jgi:hypothetical protein
MHIITLSFPGCSGSEISGQSAHEGGEVVIPTQWPPLPLRKNSWYSSLLEAESTPGPWCGWKNYDTIKIEPATFRLVAQCLNQLRHSVPTYAYVMCIVIYIYIYISKAESFFPAEFVSNYCGLRRLFESCQKGSFAIASIIAAELWCI